MSPFEQYRILKEKSGSHSPSIASVIKEITGINIKIDACFLSNPYATELFLKYFNNELIQGNRIRDLFEYYPSQNPIIADYLSKTLCIDKKYIFISNGAIEGIQAVLHNFLKGRISIPIPTFSSYYEFCKPGLEPIYYKTLKSEGYIIDLKEYEKFIETNKVNNALIINPNNPTGLYIEKKDMIDFIERNKHLDSILIDESFIHFGYEDERLTIPSIQEVIGIYDNVYIFKSMSKDFGIAGLRAGYVLMSKDNVSNLLKNGYLWNINGLSEYFFRLYSDVLFHAEYDKLRIRYIAEINKFKSMLNKNKKIRILDSRANFMLVEIINGKSSEEVMLELLFNHGIYVRNCTDKIGLEGEYIRVACRTHEENISISNVLESI